MALADAEAEAKATVAARPFARPEEVAGLVIEVSPASASS